MRKPVKNSLYLSAHMRGIKFVGTDPTMIFHFMEKYHEAFIYLSMSDNDVFLVFDRFLEETENLPFETKISSERTMSDVRGL